MPNADAFFGDGGKKLFDSETASAKDYFNAIKSGIEKTTALNTYFGSSNELIKKTAKDYDVTKGTVDEFKSKIQASAIAVEASSKSLTDANKTIHAYNNSHKILNVSQKDFASAVAQTNAPLGSYLTQLNGAQASIWGYIGSLAIATAKQALFNTLMAGLQAGAIFIATKAITGLVKVFDNLYTSIAESEEKMKDAFSEFEIAKNDAQGVEQELESINGQIDTLNAKNGITLVEQAELDKLREAKELLEMQLLVAKEKERQNAIDTADTVFENFKKNKYHKDVPTEEAIADAKEAIDIAGALKDDDGVTSNIAEYLDYTERLSRVLPYLGKTYGELQEEFLTTGQTLGFTGDNLERFVKGADRAWEELSDFERDYGIIDSGDPEEIKEIGDNYRKALIAQYDVFDDYKTKLSVLTEDQVNSLSEQKRTWYDYIMFTHGMLEKTLYPEEIKQQKFNQIFDNEEVKKSKSELLKYAAAQKGVGLTTDYLIQKYPELSASIEESLKEINQEYGYEFTINDFVAHINREAGVSNLEELRMQAVRQINNELKNLEVDVEPKIDGGQLYDWLDTLTPEEQEVFHQIRVEPDFVISDYTAEELEKKIDERINLKKTTAESFANIFKEGDHSLSEKISTELEKIDTIKEAMKSVMSGEFDNEALFALMEEFPEAINHTGNMMEFLKSQIEEVIGKEIELAEGTKDTTGIIGMLDDAIAEAADNPEAVASLMQLKNLVLELAYATAEDFTINIEVETSSLEALRTALDEARSATGLTQESVEALQNRYKGLAGFNPLELFESTNTGLYLNNGVLADLEEAYEKNKFEKIGNQLAYLKEQLVYAGSDAEHDFILEQITKLELLEAQYVGLTSEYNKWTQAQASANDRDMYESVTGGKETVKKLIEQGWATSDDVTSYLDLMTSDGMIERLFGKNADGTSKKIEDLTADQVETLFKALDKNIEGTKYSIFDFFTTDKDGNVTSAGVANFFDVIKKKFAGTDIVGEDGTFNFLGDNIQEVADALEMDVELIEILLRAAQEAGMKVEFDSMFTGLDENITKVDSLKQKLDELGKTYVEIDVHTNKENIDSEIDKAKQEYKKAFASGDQDLLNYYGASIDTLVSRKNYKNFMGVDTSQLEGDMQKGMELLQKWQTAKNEVESAGIKGDKDTQLAAEQQIQDLEKQLDELSPEIKAKLGFEEGDTASSFLSKIEQGTLTVDIQAILSEANKSDIQMLYEMNGQTVSIGVDVEGNAKETVDTINTLPTDKTISIDAQFTDHFAGLLQVISELNTFNPVVKIDAEPGNGIESVKTDIESIGTRIPAVQINIDLDPDSQSSIIADINSIGANTQPIKIIADVDKTQVSQLDSDVSKQRNANIVAIVYDGQLNALDQDVENVPDAEIVVNVFRDKFDGLKSEVESGLDATINVTLDPEDPLSEIKQYAGHRDSNTNPNGTPKDTGGIINNPARSGSSSYGLGSQVKFENPLEKVKDEEVTLEIEVENQDDVDALNESIEILDDHQFNVEAEVIGQEELKEMQETHSSITDLFPKVEAQTFGVEDLRILKQEISTVSGKSVDVTANVFGIDDVRALKDAIDGIQSKEVSVSAKTSKSSSKASSYQGGVVTGTAYSQGNWGTKSSGTALMGELGQELLVRDGRFYTVGDNSAEFVNYKRGDIIFNHEQTKQIFEHGRILYGQKRAHALVGGTAFATGNAFATANGATSSGSVKRPTTISILTSSSGGKNTESKASKKSSDKDAEEIFDWIEIAIDRIERAIDNLELKATSAFRTWGERTSNLRSQMSKVTDEIDLQKKAYDRYIQEANSVGLDAKYAKLVREGAIDIETIKDEDLIEKIKNYQEWYLLCPST